MTSDVIAAGSAVGPTRAQHALSGAPDAPTVPLVFRLEETRLSSFSLVPTVGTPRAVTAQELRVECMFPADDATEQAHLDLPGD